MTELTVKKQYLSENAAEVTTLAYFAVSCAYLLGLVLSFVFPGPWTNSYVLGLTGVVLAFSSLGWIWLRIRPVEPKHAHIALTSLAAIAAVQTGAVLYELADPVHTGNQLLAMFATAFFLTCRGWFYFAIALIVGCWAPAAIAGYQTGVMTAHWEIWVNLMMAATILAVSIFEARRRSILRTYGLKRAAEAALIDAQEANQKHASMQGIMQDSQRREALGVLAGGIAHDFNNLLTVISGNLELLRMPADGKEMATARPNDTQELLEDMHKASERATELTQQLLVYAGRSTPRKSRIKLGKRIRSAARLVESSIPPNVSIVLEGKSDGPEISVDSTLIDQLVLNLIHNATDACEADGGTIILNWRTLEMDRALLDTHTFSEEPSPGLYAITEITDNGPGMDDETQTRMLEPFYTTKTNGSGLGLAVVTGILESHRAGISVTSKLGEGCTICLAIPMFNIEQSGEQQEKAV